MKKNNQKGITLIALVVTIVVLLILAGISISMLGGENGIIGQSKNAKEAAEIDNDDTLVVKFTESNRYYEVDNDGNVEKIDITIDQNPGDIRTGIDGDTLSGTKESPFEIWCIEDLVEWSQNYIEYKDIYIKLCRILNFNSTLSYTDGRILGCTSIDELKELLTNTSGSGFTPIYEFAGSFDGQNFEIDNIYINTNDDAGLIRWLMNDFKISNLRISGNVISNEGYAGGIVGFSNASNLSIANNYNIGTITSTKKKGEIVGTSCTPIYNCYYLESCIDKANSTETIAYNETDLKSSSFIEKLNNYIESNVDNIKTDEWSYWKSGENGYPTFGTN